ncbi:E3 ubiquitin-protein ligase RNF123-like, partial [Phyllobates terribilis]|uniref:E3 ubiquitin-protein ligase RNF123-like n=1 Tax=Phyllobates terribilis TaxID=111132 RepID=UPI003CCB254D
MASRGSGAPLTKRSFRLSSEPEKTKLTGIVTERLLSQYLHRVFPGSEGAQHGANYRKPLTFHNLDERLDRLLTDAQTTDEGA